MHIKLTINEVWRASQAGLDDVASGLLQTFFSLFRSILMSSKIHIKKTECGLMSHARKNPGSF